MIYTTDSLTSLVSGMGNVQRDKLASTTYSYVELTDEQLTNAYRNSWVAKRLVDVPAMDAIKSWRVWQTDNDSLNALEQLEDKLSIKQKLMQTIIASRALGGAGLYIGTKDQDLLQPLDPSRVKKDGLSYLIVFPRTALVAGDLDDNVLSPHFGKPKYYEVVSNGNIVKIHPSRFVLFFGEPRLDEWAYSGASRGWGDSVLQAAYNWVRNADSTGYNIASLIFEANINVFKIPDLFDKLGDPEQEGKIHKRLSLASVQKGINGDLVMDSAEEFIRNSASFGGLSDILERFIVYVGASQGIPANKFLGQANKGLSDGKDLLTNYYDDIRAMQMLEIQPALQILDECLVRSALGHKPDNISYLWQPLEQPNAKEISETGKNLASMAETLVNTGLFEPQEMREAMTTKLVNDDVLSNLGDIIDKSNSELGSDLGLDNPSNDDGLPTANTV
ncbi:DUF1073 domain-containing protein [Faucicola atlantae]|nr:anti-CBASS Acb1 family protein [Moraxella atlantae]